MATPSISFVPRAPKLFTNFQRCRTTEEKRRRLIGAAVFVIIRARVVMGALRRFLSGIKKDAH